MEMEGVIMSVAVEGRGRQASSMLLLWGNGGADGDGGNHDEKAKKHIRALQQHHCSSGVISKEAGSTTGDRGCK